MDGEPVAGKRDGYDLRTLWDFERQRAVWRRDDGGYDLRFTLFAGAGSKAEDAHHDGAEANDYESRKSRDDDLEVALQPLFAHQVGCGWLRFVGHREDVSFLL